MAQNFVSSAFSTLWSNEKQFVEAERKFSVLQPEDHVSFFYQMLKKRKLLPVIGAKCAKSNAEATKLKKLGDEAFCKNDDISAVKFYTKSAAMALPNSAELASAYTNRSAALFRLDSYTACLRDIQRALDSDGNQKLKLQLQNRKMTCLMKLTLKQELKAITHKLTINSDHSLKQKKPPTVTLENTNSETSYIPNATNKLKITFSPKYGRQVIATKEIKPGEILCIENPYASVLSMDLAHSHCANCYLRCDSLAACPNCTEVMFCTAICRDNACNRFHRTECEIVRYAQQFGIKDNSWLAIRMLMVASSQGREVETMMKHSIFGYPMKKETYVLPSEDSESYAYIHNLEDHVEKRCFDYPNGLMAALLLHILKRSSFFGSTKKNNDLDSTKKETFVGTLLLKFLLAIECNALKIFETVNLTEDTSTFLEKQIGWSIYSFHSFFNHSCDENATKHFHNDTIVTRAVQLIYPGQQICINYYRNFNNCRREIREKYLYEQYYFRCTCRACEEDWPQLENIAGSVLPKLKANSISMETLRHYLSRSLHLRQKNSLFFDDRLILALCEYLAIIQKSVKMPFKEYYECQEKLSQILATQANFYSDVNQANSLVYLT